METIDVTCRRLTGEIALRTRVRAGRPRRTSARFDSMVMGVLLAARAAAPRPGPDVRSRGVDVADDAA